ncbi:MAG: hypothetical protein HYW97_00140 [Candidatus Wildermuthbacteria bacterium]|nr:hypothetical protein [Candidatus Wildermuthbacteria bacterium]
MAQERRVLPEGETYPDQLARRFPVKLPKPNSVLIVALVLLAVGMLILTTISREDKPFTGVKGQIETAPVVSQAQVEELQPAPAVPVAKEWPKIEDGRWTYTFNVGSVPSVDDPIYNGKEHPVGAWNTSAPPNATLGAMREIAKFLVPSITAEDVVGLSIARSRDNSSIVLASVIVDRETMKTYLFLSVDGMKTAKEIPISFMDPEKYAIDDVIVTGVSPIVVTVRPFSSYGYWQREILP